jgi:hypothetical protein
MPPDKIWIMWFHASFPGNPWWENPDGSVLANIEGHEGNLPVMTQM